MPHPLVGAQHDHANLLPSGRRGGVALARALLQIVRIAHKCVRFPVRCADIELHIPDWLKHAFDRALRDLRSVQRERRHGMGDPVITLSRVNEGYDEGRPLLTRDIIRQNLVQYPILCRAALLAVNFL